MLQTLPPGPSLGVLASGVGVVLLSQWQTGLPFTTFNVGAICVVGACDEMLWQI